MWRWKIFGALVALNIGDLVATAAEWHRFTPDVEGNPLLPHSLAVVGLLKAGWLSLLGIGLIGTAVTSRWIYITLMALAVGFGILLAWHVENLK